MSALLGHPESQMHEIGVQPFENTWDKTDLINSVIQQECNFCDSSEILYPIPEALYLVLGPIGCIAYAWNNRGLHFVGSQKRTSEISTNLQEHNTILDCESKLFLTLSSLINQYQPKAVFLYPTFTGLVRDNIDAVCKRIGNEKGIPVIAMHSKNSKGNQKDSHVVDCEILFQLIGTGKTNDIGPCSINILSEFNLTSEVGIIRRYFNRMGVQVISVMTGDGHVEEIQRAHGAALNIVQRSSSMIHLAQLIEEKYGIPFISVSFFGLEDVAAALYTVADHFYGQNPEILTRTQTLVREEVGAILPKFSVYRKDLQKINAAVYAYDGFETFSLIRVLHTLGMKVVLVGSQTSSAEDYQHMQEMIRQDTITLKNANPQEFFRCMIEKDVDLLIGGIEERSIARKLGIGFYDYKHERKIPMAGFEGMVNFANEVYTTVTSPIWKLVPRRMKKGPFVREGIV